MGKPFQNIHNPWAVAGGYPSVKEKYLVHLDRWQIIPAIPVGQFVRRILADTVRAVATGHDHQILWGVVDDLFPGEFPGETPRHRQPLFATG